MNASKTFKFVLPNSSPKKAVQCTLQLAIRKNSSFAMASTTLGIITKKKVFDNLMGRQ